MARRRSRSSRISPGPGQTPARPPRPLPSYLPSPRAG
uniref:Uncharacterized protein n=1 Tax=Arundo donax TaxID=35708 RepID=A0A0A9EDX8_ARUDO